MADEYQSSMSIPLDSDGFLRRECPTCEREFKVFVIPEADDESQAQSPKPGGYFCPCCAIQSQPDAWFTKAQLAKAQSILLQEFVEPELEKFKRSIEGTPGVSVEINVADQPVPELSESDDMRRVDFSCHPKTPVKVAEDYDQAVHCYLCGQPA